MEQKFYIIFRKSIAARLLLLFSLLVGGGNSVWGDTLLKSIDFSDAEWSSVTFSQGNTTTPDVANGVTFYASSSTKKFSLSEGVLTFPDNNMGSSNYALGFPISGIVGGIVIIKVYNGNSASQVKYTIKDGATEFSSSDIGNGTAAPTYGIPCTIINTGGSDSKAFIYIGRNSSSYKTITKIEVLTIGLNNLEESSFYKLYATSYTSAANLIANASLPSFIVTDVSSNENTNNNSSVVSSPHNFASLTSSYYYRLKTSDANTIAIGGLSHVKSIRLYGNGSGKDGTIKIDITKISGSGDVMTVDAVGYENSQKTIVEYSTGDLSALDGYDADSYYFYTITFAGKSSSSTYFSLWGLYLEAMPSSFTVSYDANGGTGSISNSSGGSITLSDGTGLTAPSGYTFAGWNTDAHGTGISYTSGQENVKADLALYAVWTQSGTIDDNGGTADGAFTATYNKATITVNAEPTSTGYAVRGYYNAGTGDDLVATPAGALQSSTSYTDASGYWIHTGAVPTLYAQWENTHELTVAVNDEDMGSAGAAKTTIAESETTTVTAAANPGYKFRSWAVSGTGAELSSETDNPTMLTMGTADATVMATFSALKHYTITYAKGANGIGEDIADGDKTEDADFTLSSSIYTYANHLQTGWATSDGGDKAYDLGDTYTTNANLTLYPYWIEQYTLNYEANGGSGSMSDDVGTGSITLPANAFTRSGYTFIGWATSQSDADNRVVTYSDKSAYTFSATETLYAVWGENYYGFIPNSESGNLAIGDIVDSSTGGTMKVVGLNKNGSIAYDTNGLKLSGGSADSLRIILHDYLKAGSVISVTLKAGGQGTRGLKLYNTLGLHEQTLGWSSATANEVATFQYAITNNDGYSGTKEFRLVRNNTIHIQSLTVTDCQPGGVITESGWNTYSSNKKLDLSTISGGTAYIATSVDGDKIKLKECTDIVDAGTGLMIQGTAGNTFTIDAATNSEATLSETNKMVGLPNGGEAPVGSYVFGWPETDATDYGFYYVNASAATLDAGKAYLAAGGGGARLSIAFEDDEVVTGISELNSSKRTNDVIYDLQGRKVQNPTKGLFITNGHKVFVGNKR